MTRERKEYIDSCLDWETNDPESQEWRDDLTAEEQAYVDAADERYRLGMLRLCEAIQAAESSRLSGRMRDESCGSNTTCPPA